ncbi:hypothetical protein MBLNU457_g2769t1 [Dothideomycetes sp. NU457]
MNGAVLVTSDDGAMSAKQLVSSLAAASRSRSVRPCTVQALNSFLSSFFPIRPRDVPFSYHTPRAGWFNAETAPVTHVVFSITPTEGVYTALSQRTQCPPLAFLHRPFNLERHRLRRGTTVLSSHVGFDEVLTVGWNPELASRLGVNVPLSECLQGYKGDPERRIGLVGPVSSSAQDLVQRIKGQFSDVEAVFGVDQDLVQPIKVVAIMNAFHPEEVDRVLATAHERGWIEAPTDGSQILYLTGAVREPGLVASQEKGFKVVCVGHRPCEEWGIHYLADQLRSQWPSLNVVEIYEDEPPPPPKQPKRKKLEANAVVEGSEKESLPAPKLVKSEPSREDDNVKREPVNTLTESTVEGLDTSVAANDTEEGGVKI